MKIEEAKGTASEKGAVPFDFSKILKKYDFSEHRKINGFARKRL